MIKINKQKKKCVRLKQNKKTLTVHLKVNGNTSLPRSGSARVKLSRPSTGLDVFPKEHDPVLVTLLWYSLRHSLKKVLQGETQRGDVGARVEPPQHSPFESSPRGLAISNTCSSKKPEPCAHWNKRDTPLGPRTTKQFWWRKVEECRWLVFGRGERAGFSHNNTRTINEKNNAT